MESRRTDYRPPTSIVHDRRDVTFRERRTLSWSEREGLDRLRFPPVKRTYTVRHRIVWALQCEKEQKNHLFLNNCKGNSGIETVN